MPAEIVYDYLATRSDTELKSADLIVGFGHFDLRIARYCGELWQAGLAPRILFIGGVGAGSADLGKPEAEAFADELFRLIPDFSRDQLMIESSSTNTSENVRFSLAQINEEGWTVTSAILVATPFRQRRVNQTWTKVAATPFQSAPPPSDLATDAKVFAAKGEELWAQLPGEIERLQTYPARGWIEDVPIPPKVLAAVTD